jgi:hypothetical protein
MPCVDCALWRAVGYDVLDEKTPEGDPVYRATWGDCRLQGESKAAESCERYMPKPPAQPQETLP